VHSRRTPSLWYAAITSSCFFANPGAMRISSALTVHADGVQYSRHGNPCRKTLKPLKPVLPDGFV